MNKHELLDLMTRLLLTKIAVADALSRLGQLHCLIDTQEIADAGAALADARDAVGKLDARLRERYQEAQ